MLLAIQTKPKEAKFSRRVSFTGHIPQVTGTGHSNCAPKRNMFFLEMFIRACLVLDSMAFVDSMAKSLQACGKSRETLKF